MYLQINSTNQTERILPASRDNNHRFYQEAVIIVFFRSCDYQLAFEK